MILLLGGTGYVGQAFQQELRRRAVPFQNVARADWDYTHRATLAARLRELRPDFLVNCAGYTGKPNVDACELHKADCLDGNAVLPGLLAETCGELGIPWGHVSSGCIFTGDKGPAPDGTPLGFAETDTPNFSFRTNHCSFYSGTKALGEEAMGCATHQNRYHPDPAVDAFIWRLRIPFDNQDNPRNYLTKLLRYARLLDARNSLSHLGEFAAAALDCHARRLPFGIYNLTNPGSLTARDVVELIRAEHHRRLNAGRPSPFKDTFDFFASEDEFMDKAAKTPRSNCVLDTAKAQAAGLNMTPVRDKIAECLATWRPV